MERVVTINLNGNAYQLEQGAYDALFAYLGAAEAGLKDNPDRAEIISDLEQAIADKCAVALGARKTVVSSAEMSAILKEMGPVTDGASAANDSTTEKPKAATDDGADKRLYRLREGALFAGVCSGIGAYFKIDPTIVRVLFVIAAFITQGAALIVYAVMMFVVPSAETSEEWAAAHGLPFNAQEVIDTAKKRFAEVAENQSRAWRRAQRRKAPKMSAFAAPAQAAETGYATRMLAGFVASICALVEAALGLAGIFVAWSLFTTGGVLGVDAPDAWPLWGSMIGALIVFWLVSWPFRAARRASFAALGYGRESAEFAYGMFSLLLTIGGVWYAYQYWPAAREVIEPIYLWIKAILAPGGF